VNLNNANKVSNLVSQEIKTGVAASDLREV